MTDPLRPDLLLQEHEAAVRQVAERLSAELFLRPDNALALVRYWIQLGVTDPQARLPPLALKSLAAQLIGEPALKPDLTIFVFKSANDMPLNFKMKLFKGRTLLLTSAKHIELAEMHLVLYYVALLTRPFLGIRHFAFKNVAHSGTRGELVFSSFTENDALATHVDPAYLLLLALWEVSLHFKRVKLDSDKEGRHLITRMLQDTHVGLKEVLEPHAYDQGSLCYAILQLLGNHTSDFVAFTTALDALVSNCNEKKWRAYCARLKEESGVSGMDLEV